MIIAISFKFAEVRDFFSFSALFTALCSNTHYEMLDGQLNT